MLATSRTSATGGTAEKERLPEKAGTPAVAEIMDVFIIDLTAILHQREKAWRRAIGRRSELSTVV
jgi:hypothetical protein